MASAPTLFCISIFLALNFSSFRLVSSSSCHPQSTPFLYLLRLQCPLPISSSPPLQVNGEALERVLRSNPVNSYTALLFYGSWCSFSSSFRHKFDMLSSMYPQVEHIEVEQSSTMPSLLSRYGIHSVPALLIINQTTKVRYSGKKDLHSLAQFYQKTTGLDSVKDLLPPRSSDSVNAPNENNGPSGYQVLSWKEMIVKEPYLLFAISFLTLRIFLHFSSQLLGVLTALWKKCKRHLNLGVFGESRQLWGRILQITDVKRAWNKLKWCQTRNFHKGARSARVWASSLASVSLGEASSA